MEGDRWGKEKEIVREGEGERGSEGEGEREGGEIGREAGEIEREREGERGGRRGRDREGGKERRRERETDRDGERELWYYSEKKASKNTDHIVFHFPCTSKKIIPIWQFREIIVVNKS